MTKRRRLRNWLEQMAAGALLTVIMLALFVLLYAAGLTALGIDPACAETMYVAVEKGSHLNGRASPVDGAIEAKLLPGWEVEVVRTADGWALIDGYGEGGCCWVDAHYLAPEQMNETACEPVEMRAAVDKLRVRRCPGGDVCMRLSKGDRVTVTGWMQMDGTRWAYIGTGWVMAEYLEQ